MSSRRVFLGQLAAAGVGASFLRGRAQAAPVLMDPVRPPVGGLGARFPDLARHFAFEYYPWYGGAPAYDHWDYLDRRPPLDLSTHYMPRLGPYDVRSHAVLEQHAQWIRGAGVGAVALSWWGQGSWQDQRVHQVMDVFKDYDLKVTFGLEPYANDRGVRFAEDVFYLLREYGERRRFDAFLVLRNEDGRSGPVFKGFRTILPETETDCRGRVTAVPDYTPDSVWWAQNDRIRQTLRGDFDHVTLLADSLHFGRTPAAGFDGIGIYDNFLGPELYPGIARGASDAGLLFALNVNPGYDQVEPRVVAPDKQECYRPRDVAPPPPAPYDWSSAVDRERAASASAERIRASFAATVGVQSDPALTNRRRGFLLVYLNSWNEWHEGHQFEPMKDAADLTAAERQHGYRNPARGGERLEVLASLIREARGGEPG